MCEEAGSRLFLLADRPYITGVAQATVGRPIDLGHVPAWMRVE